MRNNRKPYPNGVLFETNADNAVLVAIVSAAADFAAKMVPVISDPDLPETCFVFLRRSIKYRAESMTQYVRMPWRTIQDGVADCKSFAVFIASLSARAGFTAGLRFVKQHGEDHYSHVYTIVDGVAYDPCLPMWGEECEYTESLDVPVAV